MSTLAPNGSSYASVSDLAPNADELRQAALIPVLLSFYAAGCVLVITSGIWRDPLYGIAPGLALCALTAVVWTIGRWRGNVAAWTLVAGSLAVIAAELWFCHLAAVVPLLVLPVGLAAVLVGAVGGVLTAAGCTAFFLLAPSITLPVDAAQRAVILLALWSVVGLIWLATRPLVTALEWSWSSYQQNRLLLEQARDRQVQLKQTLADLADANLQLAHLNQLAQALRQAADEARRAKERFVANVSHELRTPLNMILGFSEAILQMPHGYSRKLPAALLADLEVIYRNSQHLSNLVDDVLELSQIEAGQAALTRESVALEEIASEAVTAVQPLFRSKGLALDMEIEAGLPAVFWDRTRIREVILNLLSNAGRFTERGGVRLKAWREGEDIVVSVADTGPGIAEADQARLFRPFQQLDVSLRRRHGGSGLGLAISKSFVELHGGTMWVESKVDVGTTFYFRLPIHAPAPPSRDHTRWQVPEWEYRQRTRPSRAPVARLRPRLVLLEKGDTLRRVLTRHMDGVEVVPVTTYEEAIRELAQTPTQVLLVNAASVSQVLPRVHDCVSATEGTVAIVCSLCPLQGAEVIAGSCDYLIKPVAAERLLAVLDGLHLKGETVLVVDDEPEVSRLFMRMFAAAGRSYHVLRATDGEQALAIMREQHPDVVLLDLAMPGMDGFRLLESKNQDADLRDIPVVVISARDPLGQPIVSNALAVTRAGGLSMQQLLTCIEGLSQTLSFAGPLPGPAYATGPNG